MIRRSLLIATVVIAGLLTAAPAALGAEEECSLEPRAKCFGVQSLSAELSTTEAGAHPDLTFSFDIKQDPTTKTNSFGLHDAYAPPRNVRVELPPGLIGNPGVLGEPQQCTAAELSAEDCPNGSQIGLTEVFAYGLNSTFLEPVYMMAPPGGDVVARAGFIAGIVPIYVDFSVRTEGDFGLTAEIVDPPTIVNLLRAVTTAWGVPAASVHDTERCTPSEVLLKGCKKSPPRPPGVRELPFITNPTRCGVPLEMQVSAASWVEPNNFDTKSDSFPQISGCDKLPFGPSLVIEPTNRRAAAPTGLDVTARSPAAVGVEVLEPAQVRDIRVRLPEGLVVNPASADGLEACSEAQAHFGEDAASECPDGAKLADFEVEIPALPRRMKGAVYLREPEPGNLYRFWALADDLGVHVKLTGQLRIDEASGQIESLLLDLPQAPLREVKLVFKSGFRAPLVNPPRCGDYSSTYEFTPWSGGPPIDGVSTLKINEGCEAGGFAPKLSGGTTDPTAGAHSPFVFTLTRQDGEQNPELLDITLPKGLTATFAGIPRCSGLEATEGNCPDASLIGRVRGAVGAGPAPLWVPQPGKRPTAVYLGGPYEGFPLSVIAVVPAQAGPFDLGNQIVRSGVTVDPVTAQGIVHSDPLPQILEGVPVRYRALNVEMDREDFTLNPTGCARKRIESTITSSEGATANPSAPFTATNCARLPFKPKLSMRLHGGTNRGAHPRLRTTLRMPQGGANIGAFSVALPRSAFLDQAHIRTVCTRVQFRADECPAGSIYGQVKARTPLVEETLEGNLYLRSSDNPLPDMVAVLKGPPSLPVEVHAVGRIDSVNGGIRASFDAVPDAPLTEVLASFPGGSKGLIVNSTNLCLKPNRVTAKFFAHNGRRSTLRPVMKNGCKKKGKQGSKRRR